MSENTINVVTLVGSLRKESINRQIARVAAENAPAGVWVEVVDSLGALPFYSEDIDGAEPTDVDEKVAALRTRVADADAVLIATPEYNGTIPAALKNAIDWLSRPYGQGALTDKPVGVVGASLGQYAGTWSRADTQKSVGVAGGKVIEAVDLGIRTSTLDDAGVNHPDVVAKIVEAVAVLARAVGEPVAAGA